MRITNEIKNEIRSFCNKGYSLAQIFEQMHLYRDVSIMEMREICYGSPSIGTIIEANKLQEASQKSWEIMRKK